MAAAGGDLRVGDRVLIRETDESSSVPGTVVKQAGAGRWAVKADGSMKSRIMLSECLTAMDPATEQTCVVVGSWDDFDDSNVMRWDARNACFEYWVVLRGEHSFKFLLGGDWGRCVHPPAMDALPYNDSAVLGPDDGGLGEHCWTVGGPGDSEAVDGAKYKICLYMTRGGAPLRVDCRVYVPPARAGAVEKPARAGAVENARPPDTPQKPAPAVARSLAHALTEALEGPDPGTQGEHLVAADDADRAARQARQRAREEERRVVEEERAARERLAKRLEAAAEADMLRIRDQEEEEEGGRDRRGAPSETRPATVIEKLGEICYECRQASDRWCCAHCWDAYESLVERGWDAEVRISGIAAGDHARRAAERWKLMPQRARESILCQFQCHFPRRGPPATPEMLQREHKLFLILPSKAAVAAHRKSEAGRGALDARRKAEELAELRAREAKRAAVHLAEQMKQKAAAMMRG